MLFPTALLSDVFHSAQCCNGWLMFSVVTSFSWWIVSYCRDTIFVHLCTSWLQFGYFLVIGYHKKCRNHLCVDTFSFLFGRYCIVKLRSHMETF
jgi:hypothetical protein